MNFTFWVPHEPSDDRVHGIAIEPVIGHKAEGLVTRPQFAQGAVGDTRHAVMGGVEHSLYLILAALRR